MQKQAHGLKQQIQQAESVSYVRTLLADGALYSDASERTKRSWKKAAEKRVKELTKGGK